MRGHSGLRRPAVFLYFIKLFVISFALFFLRAAWRPMETKCALAARPCALQSSHHRQQVPLPTASLLTAPRTAKSLQASSRPLQKPTTHSVKSCVQMPRLTAPLSRWSSKRRLSRQWRPSASARLGGSSRWPTKDINFISRRFLPKLGSTLSFSQTMTGASTSSRRHSALVSTVLALPNASSTVA